MYPDRVAIIDEPDQPAPPLPDLTYRQLGDIRRSIGVALDELGVPMGGRVAVVSQNSARFLTMYYGVPGNGRVIVPINFRLKPDEVAYIVEHSGAEVLLVDPEVAESLADIACKHVIVFGEESDAIFLDRPGRADAVGARRARAGVDRLHLGHHGPAEGRRADPPGALDQHDDHGLAVRHQRPRRVPASRPDVPLRRLGDAVQPEHDGRHPGRATQGRRRRRSCGGSSGMA